MKAHKYWSLGALATMIGTIYTGYKNMKSAHKYFACSTVISFMPQSKSAHRHPLRHTPESPYPQQTVLSDPVP